MDIFGDICQYFMYFAIPAVDNVTSIFDAPEWDEKVVNALAWFNTTRLLAIINSSILSPLSSVVRENQETDRALTSAQTIRLYCPCCYFLFFECILLVSPSMALLRKLKVSWNYMKFARTG